MAGLDNKTIASTFHSLLKVSTSDNQNLDSTVRDIVDGEDTVSCLALTSKNASHKSQVTIDGDHSTGTVLHINNGYTSTDTGDPMIKFQLSGSSIATAGIDDSDSNKFKIHYSDGFGTGINGLNAITIDSSGLVGIGTADPDKRLHVHQANACEVHIESTNNNSLLSIEAGSTSYDSIINFDCNGDASAAQILYSHHASPGTQEMQFKVGDGAVTAITIDGTGNVDFGVDGTGGDIKFFGDTASTGYMLWDQSADDLIFGSSSKVGIGAAPTYHLDILAASGSDGVLRVAGNGAGDAYMYLKAGAVGQDSGIYFDTTGDNSRGRIYYDHNGTPASQKMHFQTGDNSGTTVMTMLGDGKVGIGTTGPTSLLEIRGTLTVGVDDTGHDVKFFGDTASRYWEWDTSADGVVQRGTLTVGVDGTGHDVKFFGDTASNYMLWDESADELIIQTTSGGLTLSSTAGADSSVRPQLLIDGNTGGGSPGLAAAIQLNSDTNARGKGIVYTSTDDNQHWFSGIPYNTNDPEFFMIGYHDNATWQPHYMAQSLLRLQDTGQLTLGVAEANVGEYIFNCVANTADDDAGTNHDGWIARFMNRGDHLNRGGLRVVCGQVDGGGATTYFEACDGDGNKIGSLDHNTSGTDFSIVVSSDERLKEDIVDTAITGLTTINGLKVRDFKWKRSGESTKGGFIAQEVKTVMPEAVSGTDGATYTKTSELPDEDGNFTTSTEIDPMGVSQSRMIPTLVKAIQELSAKVTALENA
jgi:hypothetical protein